MTSNSNSLRSNSKEVPQPQARFGLAIIRLTIGAMFVWVFFKSRQRAVHAERLRRIDQLLYST